jgi:hypothetical protein
MSKQKYNIFHGKFIKGENGKLIPVAMSKLKYENFLNALVLDQTVNIFMEANKDDGTLDQLAKIHACLAELARSTGHTVSELKFEIKKAAGLCFLTNHNNEKVLYCKSLADCSKEELSTVIESIIDAGDLVGLNFR